MSALVIDFVAACEARRDRRSAGAWLHGSEERAGGGAGLGSVEHDFMFWSGASGMRYVHTVYDLLLCPELPDCNVIIARRCAAGQREQIKVFRVETGAACSNLAEIRRTAAELGATEVHVHLLGTDAQHRVLIENDLEAAADCRSERVAS